MSNLGLENLDQILNSGQSSSNRCGLSFNSFEKRINQTNGIKFVLATVDVNPDQQPNWSC